MKLVITGSLGHISRPLTEELVQKGHSVTVISSNPERKKNVEALGATAAIGSLEDVNFLTTTFKAADAVYSMIPPGNFLDHDLDVMAYYDKLSNSYAKAIQQSGVNRLVHLSSVGAHTDKGNGILVFHYNAENILKKLLPDTAITFMRPVGFYYNLYAFINTIKTQGNIISNYGGDDKEPWASPIDIADAIAEEMITPLKGRKIRYLASDEISCNEVAAILGAAIGKSDLQWLVIPDEQLLKNMTGAGMNPQIAAGLVEMNAARRGSVLYEDYFLNRPTLGKVKMTSFAKEFAGVFNSK